MLTALRFRCSSLLLDQSWKLGLSAPNRIFASSPFFSSTAGAYDVSEVLTLPEVEKILADVKADNVTVIPTHNHCFWADFTVIATGRSDWHLRNIAQALVYRAKQKQKGAKHVKLPSVQGYNSKWIVIDYGNFVVHALDEKARAYFNLESLWTAETSGTDISDQLGFVSIHHLTVEVGDGIRKYVHYGDKDLQNAFVKVRPKNNSKRKPAKVSS